MSAITIDGLSSSLYALYLRLFKNEAISKTEPFVFRDCLANQKISEFIADSKGHEPNVWVPNLFSGSEKTDCFEFEPVQRMLSEEEKNLCVEAASRCIRNGTCIYGPEIDELTTHLQDFLGSQHVILTSSGTAALTIALLALDVKPDDEVILPANSFAATENAILAVGARPVLADVCEQSHNLDPESVESLVTSRTRVILPVDLYGGLAGMDDLKQITQKHSVALIEDACQAIGVSGVGTSAEFATLSFNTFKNFSGCGKAGALITNNAELAKKARMIAYHGFTPNHKMHKKLPMGFNALIDNLQAAVLLARLPYLAIINFRRMFLAMRYNRSFQKLENKAMLTLPKPGPNNGWHLYTILLKTEDSRNDLISFLDSQGVPSKIVYPCLSHQQDNALRQTLFKNVHLPVTEDLQSRKLALPLFNGMTISEQDQVIKGVHDFLGLSQDFM
ncbi:DegT/DnrJ/EryC1/StrS family aminotransferase [Maridesulfovibrio frigidus]|uniref:DegT/DnrJ/EryC1/StrS family aminotransferase n=1 Tax=Maridesulfovibrio frigidus TaxID=340956 RepID=UPI0004E1A72B|nr:DegT/DnrJ/EryC1/StrS family aminotransferase [Maridesulfovibrio frigidus]